MISELSRVAIYGESQYWEHLHPHLPYLSHPRVAFTAAVMTVVSSGEVALKDNLCGEVGKGQHEKVNSKPLTI